MHHRRRCRRRRRCEPPDRCTGSRWRPPRCRGCRRLCSVIIFYQAADTRPLVILYPARGESGGPRGAEVLHRLIEGGARGGRLLGTLGMGNKCY